MKECVAIIAALPREVSALVKSEGWKSRRVTGGVAVFTRERAVVVCAGMGAGRAAMAVQAARAAMPVTVLLSAGLAGACDPALRVGDVVRAGLVVDSRTGERFSCAGPDAERTQVVVTAGRIAGAQEKARLRAAYAADAVEMEAATVARLARAHGLDFRALKAVSDEAAFEMEGLAQFATDDGRFRESAFALHTALRPATWGKAVALARNSARALAALTVALNGELDWYRERD